MKVQGEGECEVGPALLIDESHRERWRTRAFDDFVADEDWKEEATQGFCAYLQQDGMRQVMGRIEIFVDEDPPESARYAVARVRDLWLHAPSGKLALVGAATLVADPPEVALDERPFCTFEVTPGDYAVDLYAYVEDAQVPPVPDFTIVLRSGFVPGNDARGGGIVG